MRVDELANESVVTGQPDEDVQTLAARMEEQEVGCLVIESDEQPVGIITDRDITLRVVGEGRDPESILATDVMTENPFCIRDDESVYDLTEMMQERGVRRAPVVSDDYKLVGIITLDDVMRHINEQQEHLAHAVGTASPTLPDHWWKRSR